MTMRVSIDPVPKDATRVQVYVGFAPPIDVARLSLFAGALGAKPHWDALRKWCAQVHTFEVPDWKKNDDIFFTEFWQDISDQELELRREALNRAMAVAT